MTAWETDSGDRVFEEQVETDDQLLAIDWSPDGGELAAGGGDGSVTILDAEGEEIEVLEEPPSAYINAVAFAPDGRSIAVATGNDEEPLKSHVSIWDWERGEIAQTIDIVGGTAIEFDPTGSTFAVGRRDGTVELRDAASGEPIRAFKAHSGLVGDLVFSADGTRIATAGEDATVAIFDASTGERQLVLRGHGYLVSGLDFSPDGRRLVTTAPDGVVRVWTLDLDELIEIARGKVTRDLTDDECRQYLRREDGCA